MKQNPRLSGYRKNKDIEIRSRETDNTIEIEIVYPNGVSSISSFDVNENISTPRNDYEF